MKAKNIYISIVVFIGILLATSSTIKVSDNDYLLDIAKNYKNYTLYSNTKQLKTKSAQSRNDHNWTISLCRQMTNEELQRLDQDKLQRNTGYFYHKDTQFMSETKLSESKHGNKIFKLYVKDITSYYLTEQPIGQIIVKETWDVKKIDSANNSYVVKLKNLNDSNWYTTTNVSQLFIMYKEPKSEKNDQGWIYSIVDINTKETKILEKGNLTNCIGCHKNNKYDRILGPN